MGALDLELIHQFLDVAGERFLLVTRGSCDMPAPRMSGTIRR
jgi:hypothetical protein